MNKQNLEYGIRKRGGCYEKDIGVSESLGYGVTLEMENAPAWGEIPERTTMAVEI